MSEIVFLAVKPPLIGKLLKDVSAHIEDRHLVISLAAGISIDFIESVSRPADLSGISEILNGKIIRLLC